METDGLLPQQRTTGTSPISRPKRWLGIGAMMLCSITANKKLRNLSSRHLELTTRRAGLVATLQTHSIVTAHPRRVPCQRVQVTALERRLTATSLFTSSKNKEGKHLCEEWRRALLGDTFQIELEFRCFVPGV